MTILQAKQRLHKKWMELTKDGADEEMMQSLSIADTVLGNYDKNLKADMVAMLTEIQLEIEEHEESIIGHYGKETKESDFPSHKIERNNGRKECVGLIQQKINALKEESEEKE